MEKALSPQETRVLDICRDVELMCADLYFYFAGLFKEDAPMKALWLKTALEEENHANQFVLAAKVKKGLVEAVDLDLWTATSTFKLVKSAVNGAKANPPSLQEALRLAMSLEERLENFHLECVARFVDPSQQKLFKSMMNDDRLHSELLQAAYEKATRRK